MSCSSHAARMIAPPEGHYQQPFACAESVPGGRVTMGFSIVARRAAAVVLVGCTLVAAGSAHAVDPYESAPPYAAPMNPLVTLAPIVTTGQQVQLTGAPPMTTYRFKGIPDGMGSMGAGGSLSLLCNHEFAQTQGTASGPLAAGARVSEAALVYAGLPTPSATLVSAHDVIQTVYVGEPPVASPPGGRLARF